MSDGQDDGTRRRTVRRTTTRVEVDPDRGVFMISVAAELAEMHPQTLRMYEARGLITPKRSPKGTRLYSAQDVERLRRIQEMTAEHGLNLAGVERVLEMEDKLRRMEDKVRRLEARAAQLHEEIELRQEEIGRLEHRRDEVRADLVRYQPRSTAMVAVRRIPVERRGGRAIPDVDVADD